MRIQIKITRTFCTLHLLLKLCATSRSSDGAFYRRQDAIRQTAHSVGNKTDIGVVIFPPGTAPRARKERRKFLFRANSDRGKERNVCTLYTNATPGIELRPASWRMRRHWDRERTAGIDWRLISVRLAIGSARRAHNQSFTSRRANQVATATWRVNERKRTERDCFFHPLACLDRFFVRVYTTQSFSQFSDSSRSKRTFLRAKGDAIFANACFFFVLPPYSKWGGREAEEAPLHL